MAPNTMPFCAIRSPHPISSILYCQRFFFCVFLLSTQVTWSTLRGCPCYTHPTEVTLSTIRLCAPRACVVRDMWITYRPYCARCMYLVHYMCRCPRYMYRFHGLISMVYVSNTRLTDHGMVGLYASHQPGICIICTCHSPWYIHHTRVPFSMLRIHVIVIGKSSTHISNYLW